MSFFANLLGGTMQGIGAGMQAVGADEERLAQQRALLQERQQGALELQRQRAEDQLYRQQEMMQMRAELGGGAGGGGGGKGINLAQMAMQAKTPEEQEKVIRLAQTFGGDNAGATIADKMFGRPQMTGTAATAGDFARYDRAGDMEAAPPTTTLERAAYDRDQGTQGLQRLYTAFLDPGKLDDHAKAERQFGLNDFGAANAAQVMQRGGSLPEASSAFQKYSGVKDDSVKDSLAEDRIAAAREREQRLREQGEANIQSREIMAKQNALIRAQGRKVDSFDDAAQKAKDEQVAKLQAELDAMTSGRGNSGSKPSGKAVPAPAPLNPASRAAAWKQKFGAAQ